MTDHASPQPCRPITDTRPAFVTAVSLCAELERLCGSMAETTRLALVGLARCELTEYGDRLPGFFELVPLASIEDGLLRLEEALTSLLRNADSPSSEVHLYEARLFVRDASGCHSR